MPKRKFIRSRRFLSSHEERDRLRGVYMERYFNLWLGAWEWEGLSKQQREFLMRRFWFDGKVAAFDILQGMKPFMGGLAPADMGDNSLLGFAPYAAVSFNLYGYPALAQLVNLRGTPYIPLRPQVVGKDCVLGWALHSQKPLVMIAQCYIERIVEVEMTIRTNLFAHKIPYTLETDDSGDVRGQDFLNRILNDELAFMVRRGQDAPKPASSGQQYIIDKLYNYKVALENELNTFLGIDNIGALEKKERMNQDEVNSQDALINDFSDSIGECLDEFCKEIKDVLGYQISVYPKASPKASDEAEDGVIEAEELPRSEEEEQ